MSTLAELADRMYRDWLHPGDEQPWRVRLDADATSSATTLSIDDSLLGADSELALHPGIVVEVGAEQVRITGVSDGSIDVQRGVNGTAASAHSDGDEVTISPKFPRRVVLDALADNTEALYPRLWRTRSSFISVEHPWTEVPADASTQAGDFYPEAMSTQGSQHAKMISLPASATGRAAIIDATRGTTGWLVYRAKFPRPVEQSDLHEDCGIEPEWESIVMLGAAAQVLMGAPEISALQVSNLTEALEAEAVPTGSASQIAREVIRHYERRLQRASADLRAAATDRIVQTPAVPAFLR